MRGLKAVGVFLCLLLPISAAAQIPTAATATVHGTVMDPTGAVIPGASVELLDTATNIARTTDTDEAGEYRFVSVPPGVYTITVSMEGFRTQRMPNLKVDVAKSYLVNFTLQVGAVAEVVEVTAGAAVELQTMDATVGTVIKGETLLRLPNLTRDMGSYAFLQPAVTPADMGALRSGAVAGARTDQHTWSLDGIDATQSKYPEQGGIMATAIPVPAEGIEEFRAGVANPNATFGRSAGGQFAAVRKRGANTFHGSAYWYHQNDNLNANSWVNNRTGVEKAEMKDNRFGFTVGGPIIKEKTFFFAHFEERRFPEADDILRRIPTDSLKAGILRFRDAAGNIVSYNLATSTLCGTTGTLPCDPRGLGISPVMSAMYALYPVGNDPAQGDGLNTIGFRDTADSSEKFRYGLVRLDHHFTENWRAEGTLMFARALAMTPSQLDIGGLLPGNVRGKAAPARSTQNYPRQGVLGLTGAITPRLTNEARVGWTRWYYWRPATNPFPPVPGTNVALSLAGEGDILHEPLNVETQEARNQGDNQHLYQIVDNLTWVKGRHTIQAGGTVRIYEHFHSRDDKVVGAMTTPVAQLDAGNFVSIPPSQRPPTCDPGPDGKFGTPDDVLTTNCLAGGDIDQWNRLYAATLGILDSVTFLGTRDGELNPNAPGIPLMGLFRSRAWEFYFSDTWRVRPSLTLTYGVNYQWQEPPKEADDRLAMATDSTTGEILTRRNYLTAKLGAALQGNIYNPEIAYMPLRALGRRRVYDTDWSNLGPRVSFAWNPSYTEGFLGRLFGDRKTVWRGGYSLVFDRINFVKLISIPMQSYGFTQTVNLIQPNLTNCNVSGTTPTDATTACRVGVDTAVTLPTLGPTAPPMVPSVPFEEVRSSQVDPDLENGRSHMLDLTLQREIPGDMILEVGWVGRWGRNLHQHYNWNSVAYMMLDPVSGQYFHQAYDILATQLRAGVSASAVSVQPWFENMLPSLATLQGLGECRTTDPNVTACAARRYGSWIRTGWLYRLWVQGLDSWRMAAGLQPFNNHQVDELRIASDGGKSVYHGMVLTLRKRMSYGFAFDFNYTWSRSLDTVGMYMNASSFFPSSFNPGLEYANSYFDFTHMANLTWYYELPFGRGRRFSTGSALDKLIGGWYASGIFTAFSGAPRYVLETDQVFGGGNTLTLDTGAIPTVKVKQGNTVHTGVPGSGGVGTTGDPAADGTGMNLFADPEAAFNSFRHVLISQDGRTGRANPLRGLPHWGLDFSVGKKTSVTETTNLVFSLDLFNLFNNPQFSDPSLSLRSPSAFGVLRSQWNAPRRIQFGFRFEF